MLLYTVNVCLVHLFISTKRISLHRYAKLGQSDHWCIFVFERCERVEMIFSFQHCARTPFLKCTRVKLKSRTKWLSKCSVNNQWLHLLTRPKGVSLEVQQA